MRNKESTKNLEDRIQQLEEELRLLKTGLNALPFGLALQNRNKDLIFSNQYYQNIQDEQAAADTELIGKGNGEENVEETFLGRFSEVHFKIGRTPEKCDAKDYRDYLEQNIPVKKDSTVKLALTLVEDISM